MAAASTVLALLLVLAAAPAARGAGPPAAPGGPDSAGAARRVVRRFPPIEVRAPLRDLQSSQTVRSIPGAALQEMPVDGLAEAVALQPGVVVQAGELHVRGGRSGETTEYLDGFRLDEPLRRRTLELPLLALREVKLVTGAPEAQYGCGLAGTLLLASVDPGPRLSADARWSTDFRLAEHYDRASARVSVPLGALGVVGAGDATLDGTWYPTLRTARSFDLPGVSIARRSEDLVQGWIKLAPVRAPQALSAQVLVSRHVREPYDPAWVLDGWTVFPPRSAPVFSPTPQPGSVRYRAADHVAITDERQTAVVLSAAAAGRDRRASATLGWLRTSSVLSVSGAREADGRRRTALYGEDPFLVVWGDYPLYRESESEVLTLRGDAERSLAGGSRLAVGAGATWEDVSLREMDWTAPVLLDQPFDVERAYRAWAPGGYAYAQTRWSTGGMVLNGGLRGEYWTPGAAGRTQTLPWDGRGTLTLSPRLGLAFPVSVRDAFSLSYARISQAPPRDFLYDRRQLITQRQPLGNPALRPETVISYEAAVQHLVGPTCAVQASVFFRDLYDQVGARDYRSSQTGFVDLRYDNAGNGHVTGCELGITYSDARRKRFEAHYTWMDARGYESRPEGEPFGPVRLGNEPPRGDRPLSWDRRHSVVVGAAFPWRDRWEVSWSTQVGSPLPWTPRQREVTDVDPALLNSRRLTWRECTNVNLRWKPLATRAMAVVCEVRNLFDTRGERASTIDGYPNPVINTLYDEYGIYRTETGNGGGAYWVASPDGSGRWVPVRDPRLYDPPTSIRMSFSYGW